MLKIKEHRRFLREIREGNFADGGRLFYFSFQLFHELGVANRHSPGVHFNTRKAVNSTARYYYY